MANNNRKDRNKNIKVFKEDSIAKFDKSRKDIVLNPRHKEIIKLFTDPFDTITSRHVQVSLNINQSTAYYHLEDKNNKYSLINQGIIIHIPNTNPAIYQLSRKGITTYRILIGGCIEFDRSVNAKKSKLTIRVHDVALKNSIARLSKTDLKFDNPVFKNVEKDYDLGFPMYEGRYENHYFLITNKSIVFKPHRIYGKPYHVLLSLHDTFKTLIRYLEEDNPSLKFDNDFTFIVSESYAFEKDAFASACVKLGTTFKNERFYIDFSEGVELEFKRVEDADKWKNHNEEYVRMVADGEITVKDLAHKNFVETDDMLLKLSENDKKVVELLNSPTYQGTLPLAQAQLSTVRELKAIIDAIVPHLPPQTPPETTPLSKTSALVYDREGLVNFWRGRKKIR